MDFEDTPEEAAFRKEVRAWIDANAPKHLEDELRRANFGCYEMSGRLHPIGSKQGTKGQYPDRCQYTRIPRVLHLTT